MRFSVYTTTQNNSAEKQAEIRRMLYDMAAAGMRDETGTQSGFDVVRDVYEDQVGFHLHVRRKIPAGQTELKAR